MRLAIVMTCRDAAPTIERALARLAPLRRRGAAVVVVDGGSADDTVRRAAACADVVVAGPRRRALQMNAGARTAAAQDADVLLFVGPGTVLPDNADRLIFRALSNSPRRWGRFDVRLRGRSRWLPPVATLLNRLSRLTGLCSHAHAIFVERGTFLALEGFAPIGHCEDVEFCRRAGTICPPLALAACVDADARDLERDGIGRSLLRHAAVRLGFLLGADPDRLVRHFGAS